MAEQLVYTVKEFCESAKIGVSFFYALQKSGKGPKVTRIGGRVLVRKTTAEEWLRKLEKAA